MNESQSAVLCPIERTSLSHRELTESGIPLGVAEAVHVGDIRAEVFAGPTDVDSSSCRR